MSEQRMSDEEFSARMDSGEDPYALVSEDRRRRGLDVTARRRSAVLLFADELYELAGRRTDEWSHGRWSREMRGKVKGFVNDVRVLLKDWHP